MDMERNGATAPAPSLDEWTGVSVEWETRKWLPWELCIYHSFTKKAFGTALCIVLIPVGLILLPLLPLITVLGMVTIRCRGPYPVGVAEVQHTFNLPTFASGGLTADEMLRLRGDRKPGVPLRLGQHGQGGVFVQFATLAEVQFA